MATSKDQITKLFLSYCWQDGGALASKLEQDLTDAGYEVWRDLNEILPGADWVEQAERGIGNCDVVVAIQSPQANDRTHSGGVRMVRNEWAYASFTAQKPIVFVKVASDLDLPLDFSLRHAEDFSSHEIPQEYQRHLTKLIAAIEQARSGELLLRDAFDHLHSVIPTVNLRLNHALSEASYIDREWLLEKIELLRADNRLVLLAASPGFGKTTFVADWVLRNPRGDSILAYHSCSSHNDDTCNPGFFIHSLVRLMSERCSSFRAALSGTINHSRYKTVEAAEESPHDAFEELITRPCLSLSAPAKQFCVVIDSIDEAIVGQAKNSFKENIASIIRVAAHRLPDWLTIVATTRDDRSLLLNFTTDSAAVIRASEFLKEIQNDLEKYVEKRLTATGIDRKTRECLVRSANGDFLYLRYICNDILSGRRSVHDSIQLPKGIEGYYREDFEVRFRGSKNHADRDESSIELVSQLLSVLVAAYQPLPEEFVKRCVRRKKTDDVTKPLLEIDQYLLRNSSSGDSRGTRSNDEISLFHQSFSDWLSGVYGQHEYCVDPKVGHALIADLLMDQFESEYRRQRKAWMLTGSRDAISHYLLENAALHCLEASRFADAVSLLNFVAETVCRGERCDDAIQIGRVRTSQRLAYRLADRTISSHEREQWLKDCDLVEVAKCFAGIYSCEICREALRLIVKLSCADREKQERVVTQLLSDDDFTTRHILGQTLGDDCLDRGDREAVQYILSLCKANEINRRQVGQVALRRMAELAPELYEQHANEILFSSGRVAYVNSDATYDQLLTIAMSKRNPFDIAPPERELWNPVWEFRRIDVATIRALMRHFGHDPGESNPRMASIEREQREHIAEIERLTARIREAEDQASEIMVLLDLYWSLGSYQELIESSAAKIAESPVAEDVIRLLFLHPYWEVAETAGCHLVEKMHGKGINAPTLITRLLDDPLWRIQYGACEAAFLYRTRDDSELFSMAIFRNFDHPNPYIRGNCAENLTSMMLPPASNATRQQKLAQRFCVPIRSWLQDEDCWTLDHIHRLLTGISDQTRQWLINGTPLSRLLRSEAGFWKSDRRTYFETLEIVKEQLVADCDNHLEIGWVESDDEVDAMVEFFDQNKTDEYISHGEVQIGRAISPRSWSPELRGVIRQEFLERRQLAEGGGLLGCRLNGILVGLAIVSVNTEPPGKPFALLEDLLVHREYRHRRIGAKILEWIIEYLSSRGVTSLFLESGQRNESAHAFFKAHGFNQVSVVMQRDVP